MRDGFRGIRQGWRRDQAMRTQVVLCLIGFGALVAFQPDLPWTLAFVLLAVGGLAAELFNSALEAALDKLHPDHDPAIGTAKEMASAAATVINIAAAAIFLAAVVTVLPR